MAEVPLPTPTDNPVPSTDIRDAVYAGAMLDKVVTSTDLTYTDRLGGEHYTVDGMKAEGDKVVEETRQNLIPLSRQYMTLADAQADIANIPEGSSTYVRSQEDSTLAIEVMNVGGTLQPTGRKMPSQEALRSIQDVLFDENIAFLFSDLDGFHIADISYDNNGQPLLNIGSMCISRSNGSALEIIDREGFYISLDDLIQKIYHIDSGYIAGMKIGRGDNALEVLDSDGFNLSLDDILARLITLEEDGGTTPVESSNIRLENLAASAGAAMTYPVTAPIAGIKKGVNIFIGFGQSLCIGDEAYSVVTRSPSILGNKMLGQAVRGAYYGKTTDATFGPLGGQNIYYDLEEKRQDGGTIITDPSVSTRMGETFMSGFLETLKTLHNRSRGVSNDEDVVLAGSVTGCVGTDLATLLKGAGTGYYERLISCIEGHVEAARAAGHTEIQVAGIPFLQGENDYDLGTSRENYLVMLNSLFDDISSDVKQITGQRDNPAFFIYQTGGVYIRQTEGNSLPVNMAQLDITTRNDTFLVAPVFPYPQVSSWGAHKSANSYRWWGCAAANTVWNIYNGMNQAPFDMIEAVYDSDAIYVAFRTPCPPLIKRPFYYVSGQKNYSDYGFSVIDATGTLSGGSLSVSIISPRVMKIKPARQLTGNVRLNLGDQLHGGGHNVADSSPQVAIFNWQYYGTDNQSVNENISELNNKPYALYNYAAIQTINVKVE
ncbi:hypothetical protein ACM64K_08045 [Klebsiella pneumoniae]|uniref:hypothetical protein n=1 Tax=Klebsiella pneumoniae TaxID=573 RepID=UPI0020A44214|nr:hypothetical protein [Klebsiella pneumoniae]MCP2553855.1 hypothetical protein [Klebsiella pneumoniae]MCP2571895.1 hypothetical protein [Klebsiella pneumoniae]MCQ0942978.1 hypothetical protein [Klebsiella pneumoniae]MCQ9696049.1 hypothetical protein [Klebsiella pneumoniae]